MLNPMQLVRMMRSSRNPMQILMNASAQNPQLKQVMRAVNGKTPKEMRQMANDLAQQCGVNLDQVARQMGLTLPK